ncbi:MAG: hypothetical protein WBB19_19290 [Desulforhopalus sp.]
MIDKLQRIAETLQFLRLPSITVGAFCLGTMITVVLISDVRESDRFLIPSVIGLLWAMSTYAFIVTFRSVPEKPDRSYRFFRKLRRRINRGWYYFIGGIFLTTTVAAIIVTLRIFSIWLRDYGG